MEKELSEIKRNSAKPNQHCLLSAWFMTDSAASMYLLSENVPTQLEYQHLYRIFL